MNKTLKTPKSPGSQQDGQGKVPGCKAGARSKLVVIDGQDYPRIKTAGKDLAFSAAQGL